jgi:FkbM family methyltransferase
LLFFIQIGSNDGVSDDPLYPRIVKIGWHGILVEPIAYLFSKLVKAHEGNNNLAFEKIAIAAREGNLPIYRIESQTKEGYTPWFERTGSLSKEHLVKHKEHIEKHGGSGKIIEEIVICKPFSYLLDKYHIEKIDLLHIDAEGYDYEIIKTIPFSRIRPRMIWYENKHFSPQDKQDCKRLLRSYGYRIIKAKDTFAYLAH